MAGSLSLTETPKPPSAKQLIEPLASPDFDELLAGMGRRALHRYLDQPEPAFGSMTSLVELGPPAVSALVKVTEDEAYDSRDLAVEAPGRNGPAARDAPPALISPLDTGNAPEECRAAGAKWKLDGDAAFARKQVVPLLEEKAGRECNGAGQTLALLGRDACRPGRP